MSQSGSIDLVQVKPTNSESGSNWTLKQSPSTESFKNIDLNDGPKRTRKPSTYVQFVVDEEEQESEGALQADQRDRRLS